MKITHHGLRIELPDDWWAEAGMAGFVAGSRTCRADQNCFEASIMDVGPARRAPGVGILNESNEDGSARGRAVKILRGFRLGEAIPPVEIVECPAGGLHRYKLTHGVHRFYCSLAAGFTHVAWVNGFDRRALNQ